ncbi:phosphatidate cytidylyltransferase [Actinoalloteichus hoggarensis]|uniref:Phosphatidate cytidylyltransferase n=1 Tax=Actinoalloteichus hoggarensis TaxID=1470176 RepID=A0A221W192_9PSEU|nr:phosphatidate cytidylyltransferase [Actinoalloteichus hoggarensis]ASO19331.1 Phosphatidate cytidylyltransferase [Actinoalloteichus hoggarensis]
MVVAGEKNAAPGIESGGLREPSASTTQDVVLVPAVKPASKTGRNLGAAVLVGLLLGAAILASLLWARHLFIVVIGAAVAVSTVETATAFRRARGIKVALTPLLVGGQAMLWVSWPFGLDGVLTAFVLTVLACLLWRVPGGSENYLRDVAGSIFVAAYIPLFATFAALLVLPEDGVLRVIAFMLVVIGSDTGGYAVGALLGRHPMAPRISPKKSWEGFAGSLIAGVAAGLIVVTLLLGGQWWHGALFGVALVATATLGDLLESLVKRDIGVKDMGTLLPGHGGLMDRMDSLLPSAMVAWVLLNWFVPVA